MNVKNCKVCGRLFNSFASNVCPKCLKMQEEQLDNVISYISEHPAAKIEEVANACGVNTNDIKRWAREERLSFPEESPIRIYCQKCGAPIKSGRYCAKCR